VEKLNLMIKKVEDELFVVNTTIETAKVIHDAASTELKAMLMKIVQHFTELKSGSTRTSFSEL
jgi:hypothetical protein